MTRFRNLVAPLCLTALCLGNAGCLAVAAAAAVGTVVAYEKGDTEAIITAKPDAVAKVAASVIESQGYRVINTETHDDGQRVIARTPTDKKITVAIEPTDEPNHVRVAARVGTFGNEAISSRIVAGIVERFE